jgi:hypothetical protein
VTVEWLVMKYVPDLRRGEPRNVAVAVMDGERAEIRALGLRSDGSINGNKVKNVVDWVDNYRGWLEYWQSLADAQAPLEDWVSNRAGDNYRIEPGGEQLFGDVPEDLGAYADEVFAVMVAPAGKPTAGDTFDRRVDTLLRAAGLLTREDYIGPDRLTARNGEAYRFPHVWRNGHVTVANTMSKFDAGRARDLLWQYEHLPPEATGKIVFTSTIDSHADNQTANLLETHAVVVSVDEASPGQAAEAFEQAAA